MPPLSLPAPSACSLQPSKWRILLVAGETSGDMHGADVVNMLKDQAPSVEIFGVGGPALRAAGMQTLVDSAAIAGMGLFEARDKVSNLIGAYHQLSGLLRAEPPDLLILIDFPEFNLRLAKIANQAGVPVFYYISPQVWAWRKRRVYTIAKRVDQLAVVFPFEPEFYAAHGCAVEFVGHPLVDRVRATRSREETLRRYQLDPNRPTIALLPGSRTQELRYLLSPLLGAATHLGAPYQAILALAPSLDRAAVEKKLAGNFFERTNVRVVQGDTYNVVHAADLTVVAAGTATLEIALLERPMVIVYRMAPLTYALARLLVGVPFIGMPNLIAERRIVPELLQSAVTPDRIAHEVRQLLRSPQAYSVVQRDLQEVRRRLGDGGATQRTAALILTMLEKSTTPRAGREQ